MSHSGQTASGVPAQGTTNAAEHVTSDAVTYAEPKHHEPAEHAEPKRHEPTEHAEPIEPEPSNHRDLLRSVFDTSFEPSLLVRFAGS